MTTSPRRLRKQAERDAKKEHSQDLEDHAKDLVEQRYATLVDTLTIAWPHVPQAMIRSEARRYATMNREQRRRALK